MQADGFPTRPGCPSRPIKGPAELSQWIENMSGWKTRDNTKFGRWKCSRIHSSALLPPCMGCPPYSLKRLGFFLSQHVLPDQSLAMLRGIERNYATIPLATSKLRIIRDSYLEFHSCDECSSSSLSPFASLHRHLYPYPHPHRHCRCRPHVYAVFVLI